MMPFLIAFAAVTALLDSPLAAQTTPAAAPAARAAPAAARISIPFNPPLDRPLRYRVTVAKPRTGRQTTVWIIYELRFAARTGGFRLTVRAADAGSPDVPRAQAVMVRRTIVDLSLPYVLLLSEAGEIEGMEDEAGYWNRMMALVETAVRQSASAHRVQDEAILAQLMQMMRETSAEARLAITTENIAPILQFGGGEFVLGETRSHDEQVEGMMGIAVRQRSDIRAERMEERRLHVSLHSTIPQEDMARAIETVMARIPVTGQGQNNQAARERGMAELRAARFDRQSRYTFSVALDSGLVHSGDGADRTVMEMGGRRTDQIASYRVERLD